MLWLSFYLSLNRFLLIFVVLEKGFLFIFFILFEKFLSLSFRPFDSLTDLCFEDLIDIILAYIDGYSTIVDDLTKTILVSNSG